MRPAWAQVGMWPVTPRPVRRQTIPDSPVEHGRNHERAGMTRDEATLLFPNGVALDDAEFSVCRYCWQWRRR